MEKCASPGLYFEVSPTQGISDAMTKLFQKVVQQARLTRVTGTFLRLTICNALSFSRFTALSSLCVKKFGSIHPFFEIAPWT